MDATKHFYYITPPTLFLPEDGLRISLIGVDSDWIENLSDDLEDTFPSIPMTFYHLDEATKDQWQWIYCMAEASNLVMINVAKCSTVELIIAISNIGNKGWFYIDKKVVDKNIIMLLNTLNANAFSDSEELYSMLRNYIGDV
jgi:hypothetical protein